jgi:hypothetical protein
LDNNNVSNKQTNNYEPNKKCDNSPLLYLA